MTISIILETDVSVRLESCYRTSTDVYKRQVHTYSGYENKVKANIDKTIENRHLEDQILEVRVPLEDVTEVKNGAVSYTHLMHHGLE